MFTGTPVCCVYRRERSRMMSEDGLSSVMTLRGCLAGTASGGGFHVRKPLLLRICSLGAAPPDSWRIRLCAAALPSRR